MDKSRSHILTALFDVRPVDNQGNLDMGKIKRVSNVLDLGQEKTKDESKQREKAIKVKRESSHSKEPPTKELPVKELPTREELLAELNEIEKAESLSRKKKVISADNELIEDFYFPEVALENFPQPIQPIHPIEQPVHPKKGFFAFLITGLLISLIVPGAVWINKGLSIKKDVLGSGLSAYQNLLSAQRSLEDADWQGAAQNFSSAHFDFLQAEEEIKKLGQVTLGILGQLPGGNLISAGSHLVTVGENLAQAGQNLAATINIFSFNNLFSLIEPTDSKKDSLTNLMDSSQANLSQALDNIKLANQALTQVKVESLPADIQGSVASLSVKLPLVEGMLGQALDYSEALLNILGHKNPRQYLLLFQNNSEMRATGGFIGTYGLLTLDKGEIEELFIDGVFNADGQLHEKIIPPRPVQKISTAWSMHDANWFADFPASAKKIAWFYEKTGGPTVDGVISFTPTVIERLMKLTGPLDMPEYGIVLTPENFVELIQYQVEVDYDQELNQPKKVLADFAPKFIQSLNQLSSAKRKEALEIIFDCLKEKHILIYFEEDSLEKVVKEEGWSGQLLETDKDYLSVVSSNINGYKTDKVVKESIKHQADIQPDGSIIDTLTIVRQHQGGQMGYDWWDRVNANYLRIYLPKGSQLISAQGQTREIYQPPIDYQKQNFKTDPLVNSIESNMIVDSESGTHIFKESDKTVFANWVYVSPGQTVTLTYQYKLPFKIDLTKSADSYSLLIQKQSGSLASQFSHKLNFPIDWQVSWQYPDDLNLNTDLKVDRFLGITFEF